MGPEWRSASEGGAQTGSRGNVRPGLDRVEADAAGDRRLAVAGEHFTLVFGLLPRRDQPRAGDAAIRYEDRLQLAALRDGSRWNLEQRPASQLEYRASEDARAKRRQHG